MLFFSLYFAMTGLHALHMIIGVGLLSYILCRAYKDGSSPAYYHAGRHCRSVLALRRHRLDFPVPAVVPDRPAHEGLT